MSRFTVEPSIYYPCLREADKELAHCHCKRKIIKSDLIPEGRLLNKCNVENIPELFFGCLGKTFVAITRQLGSALPPI